MELDIRRLNDEEIGARLVHLAGWKMANGKLSREYVFADFVEAIGLE